MATYVLGDIQGCYDELRALLAELRFDRGHDRLWFVGDLVNRGPKSLEVLRFVKALGDRAVVVLGNHDLHLVTQHEGLTRPRKDDSFQDVLAACDASELVAWLRTRPMMHVQAGYAMVHAGLLPQWSVQKSVSLGKEVEAALRAPDYRDFLRNLYGSTPDQWSDSLAGWDRLRVVVNAMTRVRFCTAAGKMEFHAKGSEPPPGYLPWYETRKEKEAFLLWGHWSALGLVLTERYAGLDSGCVWGGQLTALRLEDRCVFQLGCSGYRAPGDE